jgi:ribonuclease BN (tRNA processing enzyme)
MTTIKFFGTGSAFTLKNYQTNLGIKTDDSPKWFLIDAGGDIRHSLNKERLSYKDIDSIYISHLHNDHNGGIEWAGFSSYFDPSMKGNPIKLYGSGDLLRKGWEDSWKGGMESIQGKLMSLSDFFDVHNIKPNGKFNSHGLEFSIVQSIHVVNGYSVAPCYGLMINIQNKYTVYFTADTQFCPSSLIDFYKKADLIIQDCETNLYKSGVHANYTDLCTLPVDIKKKMFLVHYSDNVLNEKSLVSDKWQLKINEDGFWGMPDKGSTINVEEAIDSRKK